MAWYDNPAYQGGKKYEESGGSSQTPPPTPDSNEKDRIQQQIEESKQAYYKTYLERTGKFAGQDPRSQIQNVATQGGVPILKADRQPLTRTELAQARDQEQVALSRDKVVGQHTSETIRTWQRMGLAPEVLSKGEGLTVVRTTDPVRKTQEVHTLELNLDRGRTFSLKERSKDPSVKIGTAKVIGRLSAFPTIERNIQILQKEKKDYFSPYIPEKKEVKTTKTEAEIREELSFVKPLVPTLLKAREFLVGTKERIVGDYGKVKDKVTTFVKPAGDKIKAFAEWAIPETWEPSLYAKADYLKQQPSVREKAFQTLEIMQTGTSRSINPKKKSFFEKVEAETVEYAGGYVGGLRRHPIKTAVGTASYFVLPVGLKAIGKVGGPLVTALGVPSKVLSVGSGIIKYGLPTLYAGSVVLRASESERPSAKLGEISSTEITPMIVGGGAGALFWARARTWARFGGSKLKLKDITPKKYYEKIKAGKTEIPTEPVGKHLSLFEQLKYSPEKATKLVGSRYSSKRTWAKVDLKDLPAGRPKPVGYHLAGEKILGEGYSKGGEFRIKVLETKELKDLGLMVKTREATGLYLSPYPSLHFARLSPQLGIYGGDPFKPFGSPRGLVVQPKGFKVAPLIKTSESVQIGVKPGYAGVPGTIIGKPEPQAIVRAGTELGFTGDNYYFWHKGYKINLPKVKSIESGDLSLTGKSISQAMVESYSGSGYAYSTTPLSFGAGLLQSYQKTKAVDVSKSAYKQQPEYTTSYKSTPQRSVIRSDVSKTSKFSYSVPSLKSYTPSSSTTPSTAITSKITPSTSSPSKIIPSKSTPYKPYESTTPQSYVPVPPSYKTPPSYRTTPRTDEPPPELFGGFNLPKQNGRSLQKAYDVFIKQRGQFKQIGKSLPKGSALELGAKQTIKTLSATFKITESGTTLKASKRYAPSTNIFRDYKILGGKIIQTPNQFIQRRGKRLMSGSEVREIQVAKTRSPKKKKKIRWKGNYR